MEEIPMTLAIQKIVNELDEMTKKSLITSLITVPMGIWLLRKILEENKKNVY